MVNRTRKRARDASRSSIQTSPAPSRSPSPQPMDKKAKFEKRYEAATTSDADILEKQKRTWSSTVYDHYKPPEIFRDGDAVKYVFVCKRHPSIKVKRARHDESTSNLVRHAEHCDPNDSSSRTIASFGQGSTYSAPKLHMKLALWVVRRNRPFAIVEDPEFIDILTDLNNKVTISSRITLSHDVKEIFRMSQAKVAAMLQGYPGKLHICIDGWTSPNVIAFIGVTVNWVVNGGIRSLILDFVKAAKAHTGIYLAARISECLHDYGIQKKILSLVADNASNNNTLVDELSELLADFQGSLARIRCFAHILNLVVKAILSQFSKKNPATDDHNEAAEDDAVFEELQQDDAEDEDEPEIGEEADDVDEVDGSVAASDSAAVDEIAREVEDEMDQDEKLTRADINLGRFSISKLTNLGKKVFNSPTLRSDLKMCCEHVKIKPVLMIRAVSTRWNTTAELIGRAKDLRLALSLLVNMEQHNKNRGVRLRHFQLSGQEWDLLLQIYPLLDVFLEAMKKMSQSTTPLLHEVIPLFDIITAHLDRFVDDTQNFPAVRAAARRGRAMMNKYYGLSDDSIMYRVAMLLHPRYKSSYFVKAKWPRDWIATAEGILWEQWRKYYKPVEMRTSEPAAASTSKNYFAELDTFSADSMASDAIDEWLSSPPLVTVSDPIAWWSAMAGAGHPLARMALDFLSAPATSTDVECAFSRGGLTVSKMRHSLSDESVHASTVLGSWCTLPDAIPHDEIIAVFREKAKRLKGKEPAVQSVPNTSGSTSINIESD